MGNYQPTQRNTDAKGGIEALKQEIEIARFDGRQRLALAEIAELMSQLDFEIARDEVAALENELAHAQRRLASMREGVVLSGGFLRKYHIEIQAEIARAERIMKDHADGDDRIFACRRIEAAMSEKHQQIREAIPASYEKEELEMSLEALKVDYQLLTATDTDESDLERVIARVQRDNTVDDGWLKAQKLELAKLPGPAPEPSAPKRSHSQLLTSMP